MATMQACRQPEEHCYGRLPTRPPSHRPPLTHPPCHNHQLQEQHHRHQYKSSDLRSHHLPYLSRHDTPSQLDNWERGPTPKDGPFIKRARLETTPPLSPVASLYSPPPLSQPEHHPHQQHHHRRSHSTSSSLQSPRLPPPPHLKHQTHSQQQSQPPRTPSGPHQYSHGPLEHQILRPVQGHPPPPPPAQQDKRYPQPEHRPHNPLPTPPASQTQWPSLQTPPHSHSSQPHPHARPNPVPQQQQQQQQRYQQKHRTREQIEQELLQHEREQRERWQQRKKQQAAQQLEKQRALDEKLRRQEEYLQWDLQRQKQLNQQKIKQQKEEEKQKRAAVLAAKARESEHQQQQQPHLQEQQHKQQCSPQQQQREEELLQKQQREQHRLSVIAGRLPPPRGGSGLKPTQSPTTITNTHSIPPDYSPHHRPQNLSNPPPPIHQPLQQNYHPQYQNYSGPIVQIEPSLKRPRKQYQEEPHPISAQRQQLSYPRPSSQIGGHGRGSVGSAVKPSSSRSHPPSSSLRPYSPQDPCPPSPPSRKGSTVSLSKLSLGDMREEREFRPQEQQQQHHGALYPSSWPGVEREPRTEDMKGEEDDHHRIRRHSHTYPSIPGRHYANLSSHQHTHSHSSPIPQMQSTMEAQQQQHRSQLPSPLGYVVPPPSFASPKLNSPAQQDHQQHRIKTLERTSGAHSLPSSPSSTTKPDIRRPLSYEYFGSSSALRPRFSSPPSSPSVSSMHFTSVIPVAEGEDRTASSPTHSNPVPHQRPPRHDFQPQQTSQPLASSLPTLNQMSNRGEGIEGQGRRPMDLNSYSSNISVVEQEKLRPHSYSINGSPPQEPESMTLGNAVASGVAGSYHRQRTGPYSERESSYPTHHREPHQHQQRHPYPQHDLRH